MDSLRFSDTAYRSAQTSTFLFLDVEEKSISIPQRKYSLKFKSIKVLKSFYGRANKASKFSQLPFSSKTEKLISSSPSKNKYFQRPIWDFAIRTKCSTAATVRCGRRTRPVTLLSAVVAPRAPPIFRLYSEYFTCPLKAA